MKIQKDLLLEEISILIKDFFNLKKLTSSPSKIELIFENGQKFEIEIKEK